MFMKLLLYAITIILVIPALVCNAADKPLVITSTEDLASIASAIGGEAVHVEFLAPGKANTHLIEVKPSYAMKLIKADVVIIVGLAFDRWVYRLIDNSRNRNIRPGTNGFIDASEGCVILDKGKTVTRLMGDVHPQGNPHYLLNPRNGIIVAENIAKRFSGLFPDYSNVFEENLSQFKKNYKVLLDKIQPRLKLIKNAKAVSYHKMWDYFMEFSALDIVAEIEPKPGIPPTARHTQHVVNLMKQENVRIIIRSPFYEERTPKKIAAETGAVVLTLAPQVGAADKVSDYWSLFEFNVAKIYEAVHE